MVGNYFIHDIFVVFSHTYAGEPPSSVMNVTIAEKDRNTLQINWREPGITNGNITGYFVSIIIHGKGQTIFKTIDATNIVSITFNS